MIDPEVGTTLIMEARHTTYVNLDESKHSDLEHVLGNVVKISKTWLASYMIGHHRSE